MQTILLSCLFGIVCAMVIRVASSAAIMRDQMLGRDGRLAPPEER